MSSNYPDPRRVVLTLADLRRLTVLERARACAIAGISESEIGPLLRAVVARNGDPVELERAVTLLYAIAYQLERRLDASLSWDEAQTLDLALDLEAGDPIADAEARASVETSIATGLPPDVAGNLTLAQVDEYAIHARGDRARPGRTRARVRR